MPAQKNKTKDKNGSSSFFGCLRQLSDHKIYIIKRKTK